jgi:hypothetical protein
MEAVGSSETIVITFIIARSMNTEDQQLNIDHRENFKYHTKL